MLSGKRSANDEPQRHTDSKQPTPKLTDRVLFDKWLADRQRHFDEVNASPADIAYFALQDGFPETVVRQWEQHKRWEEMGKDL